MATTADATDFVAETVYDELNRPKAQVLPYSAADPRYNTPDQITYSYDEVGNPTKVSAPPSEGQTIRNNTIYSYLDNGWVKSSTDPWDTHHLRLQPARPADQPHDHQREAARIARS